MLLFSGRMGPDRKQDADGSTSAADFEGIEQRIARGRADLAHASSANLSAIPDCLASLAAALNERCQQTWQRPDLDERIDLLRQATSRLLSAMLCGHDDAQPPEPSLKTRDSCALPTIGHASSTYSGGLWMSYPDDFLLTSFAPDFSHPEL